VPFKSVATWVTGDCNGPSVLEICPCSMSEATESAFAFVISEFARKVIGGTVVNGLKSVRLPYETCIMDSKYDTCFIIAWERVLQ
jgi:hypothetical protein